MQYRSTTVVLNCTVPEKRKSYMQILLRMTRNHWWENLRVNNYDNSEKQNNSLKHGQWKFSVQHMQ